MSISALNPSETGLFFASRIKAFLKERFGNQIDRVILYGSHARGAATADSDIDILVVVNSPLRPTVVREALADLIYEILQEEAELVSVIVVEKRRYDSQMTPFLQNIQREGLEI